MKRKYKRRAKRMQDGNSPRVEFISEVLISLNSGDAPILLPAMMFQASRKPWRVALTGTESAEKGPERKGGMVM